MPTPKDSENKQSISPGQIWAYKNSLNIFLVEIFSTKVYFSQNLARGQLLKLKTSSGEEEQYTTYTTCWVDRPALIVTVLSLPPYLESVALFMGERLVIDKIHFLKNFFYSEPQEPRFFDSQYIGFLL